jgi:hypothetical protein
MNDSELNKLLKSANVPGRPAEYWERFPGRVGVALRRRTVAPERKRYWFPRLAWGLGASVACLLIGFGVGHWRGTVEIAGGNGILQDTKVIREMMEMFPNRIRAIVQDERGMSLVLSDQPDVPTSAPLWVRVYRGKECLTLLTFSGQEMQIAGQRVTVLSDAEGGVILMGDRFAWASADPGLAPADLRIQAKRLELAAL